MNETAPILEHVGGSVELVLLIWPMGGALSLLGVLTHAENGCGQSTRKRASKLHSAEFPSQLWLRLPEHRTQVQ